MTKSQKNEAHITVYLPKETAQALKEKAAAQRRSLSSLMGKLVDDFLLKNKN